MDMGRCDLEVVEMVGVEVVGMVGAGVVGMVGIDDVLYQLIIPISVLGHIQCQCLDRYSRLPISVLGHIQYDHHHR